MKAAWIRKLTCFVFLTLIVLFAPQIWSRIKFEEMIFEQIDAIPAQEFAIVFGAWVDEDRSLSDITRERVEAGVQLYKSGRVKKLFLSGDNRSNRQAEAMADFAVKNGVHPNDIITDKLGIDTNDTCKHFAEIDNKAILVTQGYHLPRTMSMCEKSQIEVSGLAADKLDILRSRGDNPLQIHAIRAWRSTREASLTWLFLLGIYDKLSTEAEVLENGE